MESLPIKHLSFRSFCIEHISLILFFYRAPLTEVSRMDHSRTSSPIEEGSVRSSPTETVFYYTIQ